MKQIVVAISLFVLINVGTLDGMLKEDRFTGSSATTSGHIKPMDKQAKQPAVLSADELNKKEYADRSKKIDKDLLKRIKDAEKGGGQDAEAEWLIALAYSEGDPSYSSLKQAIHYYILAWEHGYNVELKKIIDTVRSSVNLYKTGTKGAPQSEERAKKREELIANLQTTLDKILAPAYELLGLKPGVSKDDINKAFRKQSFALHPDKFAQNSLEQKKAAEKFKDLGSARDLLLKNL